MNTEEKKEAFVKWPPFILSVVPVMAADGLTLNLKACVILFVADLCILLAVLKVFGKNVDVRKQILLYVSLFLLSTFLKNLMVFVSLLFLLFSKYRIVLFLFFTVAGFVLLAKVLFFPGKADEKIIKAFIIVLSFVFAVSLFCVFPLGIAFLPPILLGIFCWQLIEKVKGDQRRLLFLVTCLVGFLLGGTMWIWFSDFIMCENREKIVEEAKEMAKVVEGAEKKEYTPLIAAIRDGDKITVEKLAETDVNVVDVINEIKTPPLMVAVLKGDAEIVNILIKAGADVNFRFDDGSTAIGAAIEDNNVEIAEMLADAGADMVTRYDSSLWWQAWLGGALKGRIDFRIFKLLWKKEVPFFIEGTTFSERLFYPFGLMRF